MPDHKNHFPRAYGLSGQDQTNAFYSDWAETYDAEVIANGYATPARIAAALRDEIPLDAAILDIGCGTGFSGAALRNAQFTNIVGTDPNPDMLARAQKRGVYQRTNLMDLNNPYPFEPGTYVALTAVGVIGSGAAPSSALALAANALGSGGILAFSYNDHTLETPAYINALDRVLAAGFSVVYRAYGQHLTAQNIGADVILLRAP